MLIRKVKYQFYANQMLFKYDDDPTNTKTYLGEVTRDYFWGFKSISLSIHSKVNNNRPIVQWSYRAHVDKYGFGVCVIC